jgi:hypothetical protein
MEFCTTLNAQGLGGCSLQFFELSAPILKFSLKSNDFAVTSISGVWVLAGGVNAGCRHGGCLLFEMRIPRYANGPGNRLVGRYSAHVNDVFSDACWHSMVCRASW